MDDETGGTPCMAKVLFYKNGQRSHKPILKALHTIFFKIA